MVLGVCRRVLRDYHDAEDAFQATFLVLARRAAAAVKRESVGCYLYAIAYHTALEAAASRARRRARERQVADMPHPEVMPTEALDWRPLLDQEVNRLPDRYKAAVLMCDLEGRTQRDAAELLRVPVGTLASRLTRARALLAKRLAGRGLSLSGGALAAIMLAEAASAQVPAAFVNSTARVAALVAAGQLAAASTPAVVLMKGVMKAMLMKKLRLAVGAVMVAAVLGAVGFACRPGGEARAQDQSSRSRPKDADPSAPAVGKAPADVEALRREVEDLRATVRILLKENRTLEKELEDFRARAGGFPRKPEGASDPKGQPKTADLPPPSTLPAPPKGKEPETNGRKDRAPVTLGQVEDGRIVDKSADLRFSEDPRGTRQDTLSAAAHEADVALKLLREARDPEAQQRAAQELEKAMRKVRQHLNPEAPASRGH
jgi:RNA polymerase sigma factor (sigma-70 family)